jgi:hypothetical protein
MSAVPSIQLEPICAALFALLQSVSGFRTTGRTLKHWSDVSAEMQPAGYQIQKTFSVQQVRGLPPVWRLTVDWYLYVHGSQDDNPPSVQLNVLLSAILAVVPPADSTIVQTLGGLVQWARIEGAIETDEGVLGEQSVAIIPLVILSV